MTKPAEAECPFCGGELETHEVRLPKGYAWWRKAETCTVLVCEDCGGEYIERDGGLVAWPREEEDVLG